MSYPVFYVPAGDVLPVMFATYDGGTGASLTMTGLLASDIEIYKDGSTTQRASDAGYTLLDTDGIDFDGLTGIHGFSIDTGDNTDAGFYTVGAWFTVVVSAVTVDAQTVSFIACQFRLMAAESVAAKPKVDVDAWLGTAAATPTVNGVPEVDVTHWIGTAAATPTVAGVPEVDVTHWLGTAAATPTTAGVPEVDLTHIAGAAVATTSAQLGVNVVNVGGTAQTAGDLAALINTIDDFLDTEVAAILAAVDTEVAAILALLDDARGEPAQGAPPVNPDMATKVDWLYAAWRNKKDNDGTVTNLYADDGTTVVAKQSTSESGGTVTKAEWITGA